MMTRILKCVVCSATAMPTVTFSDCQVSTMVKRPIKVAFAWNICVLVSALELYLNFDQSSINQDSGMLLIVIGR